MLLVVTARPIGPTVRLVVMMPATIWSELAIRAEPNDGAARTDEVRRQVRCPRQACRFLHQAIALARQPRRLGGTADQHLAVRHKAGNGDGTTAEARRRHLV